MLEQSNLPTLQKRRLDSRLTMLYKIVRGMVPALKAVEGKSGSVGWDFISFIFINPNNSNACHYVSPAQNLCENFVLFVRTFGARLSVFVWLCKKVLQTMK